MFFSVTLALVAALPASAFRADAQILFGKCRASSEGPSSRTYDCGEWAATIRLVSGANGTPEQVLHLMAGLFHGIVPGGLRDEAVDLAVAGVAVTARRFVPTNPTSGFGFADLVVVPVPDGDYRVAFCIGQKLTPSHEQSCATAVDYIASRGTPDDFELTIRRPPPEPGIFGHKLKVPPGCKLAAVEEGAGRIECGSSGMAWAVLNSAPAPHHLLDEAVTSVSTMGGKRVTDERLGCIVEGKEGRCAKVTAADGSAGLYVGTTVIDGHGVMVMCSTTPADPKVPAVCRESILLPSQ